MTRAHAAILAAAFVALAAWTWGTWPDVAVDFGQQLYLPWRVAQGEVLYRDLAHFNGPLSVHWNALLFKVFGASLRVLVCANLAVLAALTALAYAWVRALAGPTAAMVASLFLLAVPGFGQLVGVGNYQFVCPYAHELTHGLLLAFAGFACMRRFAATGAAVWLAAAGACAGATLLTKAELSLAAVVALGADAAWTLHLCGEWRRLTFFVTSAVLPVAIAWTLESWVLSPADALWAVLGGWKVALFGGLSDVAFFRKGMGTDDVGRSLGLMLAWSLRWTVAAAAFVGFAFVVQRLRTRTPAPWLPWAVGAVACLAVVGGDLAWKHVARPLPLLVAGVAGVSAWRLRQTRDPVWLARFSGAVFALLLLGKMPLNARLHHYGFALALPAALLAVAAWTAWLPAWRSAAPDVVRAGGMGVVAGLVVVLLRVTAGFVAGETLPLGAGGDRFLSDARGAYVQQAVAWLAQPQRQGRTVAVLPEGAMVNWLTRKVNPTGHVTVMPTEVAAYGDPAILRAFQAHPPDDVVFLHKDTSEFGARFFGRDYAAGLGDWLRAHYVEVERMGAEPLTGAGYGVSLWQRRK